MKVRKVDFSPDEFLVGVTGMKAIGTIQRRLEAAGWQSPNTYSNAYATIPNRAGLYLLLAFPAFYTRAASEFIAYVGKSTALRTRLERHDVLRQISKATPGTFIQRWFLEFRASAIDAAEVDLIRGINPPYNIQHLVPGYLQVAHG